MDSKYSHLNEMQREAVLHDKGPLLILAGAGSGKTGVLTHRIAYLIEKRDVSPYEIIALTFTNKAANEMKERVGKIVGEGADNIWVSTFHSTCVRILRRFIDLIGYERDFVIYDTDDQKSVMKEVIKSLNLDPKQFKEKAILSAVSGAKDELLDPDAYEKQNPYDYMHKTFAKCYREYQKRLWKNNALDFDDLIVKTVELFRQSSEALEYYRNRFRYLLVDEYQDTNYAQFVLISLLAKHTNEYGEIEQNLCVVGDDDQSIYKFRGANIRNILDFEKLYPDTKVIRLEQNYRSTQNILDVANNVIKNNTARKPKTLWTQNEKGASVSVFRYDTDMKEAQGVVDTIAELTDNGEYSYNDFAILYRTNAQSRIFEERFIYRNIPYKIIGGQNFYQRKEIKDILAYLRTIAGTADSVAVKRIINVPKRGIGQASIDKVDEYALNNDISFYEALKRADYIPGLSRAAQKINSFVSFIEVMKGRSASEYKVADIIEEIIEAVEYEDYLLDEYEEEEVSDRLKNIGELVSKAAVYWDEAELSEDGPSLGGFLDDVSLVADIDGLNEDDNYVVLMTIHSAKGLEFPYVFMTGMEDGLFPSSMSVFAENPNEEIAEERRLCYVGMTRARQQLVLSYASQRMIRGEITSSKQSRFLDEIPRYLIELKGDAKPRRFADEPEVKLFSAQKKSGTRAGDMLRSNPYAVKSELPKAKDIVGSGLAKDGPGYGVGDRVKHIKFGVGTVTAIVAGGRDYEVTVDFPAGTKKMLASFARLEKV